jgi:hypothetical protein
MQRRQPRENAAATLPGSQRRPQRQGVVEIRPPRLMRSSQASGTKNKDNDKVSVLSNERIDPEENAEIDAGQDPRTR